MKTRGKHLINGLTVITVTFLFFIFSNGLSFSLHYCDACKKTKIFFIEHPNCCAESEHIHKSENECNANCGCCEHGKSHSENACGSSTHHCKTTHKFIRINAPYMGSIHPVSQPLCFCVFSLVAPSENCNEPNNAFIAPSSNSPPIITQAGDSQFLNYISQHLFYS
jgi:hypothetical protein